MPTSSPFSRCDVGRVGFLWYLVMMNRRDWFAAHGCVRLCFSFFALAYSTFAALAVAACGSDSPPPPAAGPSGAGGSNAAGSNAAGTQPSQGGAGASGSAAGSGGTAAGSSAAGAAGRANAGSGGTAAGTGAAGTNAGAGGSAATSAKFSFFVTSVTAMKDLSKSPMGFGGDLRFGKATGLEGADEICRQIAERSMPGSGAKVWRAFLSATKGGANNGPVHAKDRIGDGPWYDRLERLVAMTKTDLLQARPRGADPAIINDLPNEDGVPNHTDGKPGCTGNACPDNHQVLTGTNEMGMLYSTNSGTTCEDWTSSKPEGMPWCGHSWPRQGSGVNWMSSAADGGCAPCVSLMEMGGVVDTCVGSAGGYGGFYCFALKP